MKNSRPRFLTLTRRADSYLVVSLRCFWTQYESLIEESLIEKGDRRCPYLPPSDEEVRMLDFRDEVLVRMHHRDKRARFHLERAGHAERHRRTGRSGQILTFVPLFWLPACDCAVSSESLLIQ